MEHFGLFDQIVWLRLGFSEKAPEEADKGGVLFSFSELFVSDFVGDLEGRVME